MGWIGSGRVFVLRFLSQQNLDLWAFVWFVVSTLTYSAATKYGAPHRRSIMAAVHAQRMAWMRNMANRENRTIDVILLQQLSASHTFFASTSVIVIGGLAAMLGSGERVQGLLERLPLVANSSPALFEGKILFLMTLFVYAFFKFAWAFRLTHYTAIMIGATPLATAEQSPACAAHADQVALLAGLSAEHANAGLRTYYQAIGGIAWFLHPVLFMVASTWVLAILLRREFFSRSRRALLGVGEMRGSTGDAT